MIAHAEQFLASASDEVRYRASLLREILSASDSFDNVVIAMENHGDVKAEIAKMNEERKNMTTANEKAETGEDEGAAAENGAEGEEEIDIGKALEETPREDTPREETPEEEEEEMSAKEEKEESGIKELSELLEKLTEELLPVSAKAQKKVKIPEGLDLDTPLATFELEKEVEKIMTVTFVDAPLFSYVESGHVRDCLTLTLFPNLTSSVITAMARRVIVTTKTAATST